MRNDLHAYDTAQHAWTDLSTPRAGDPPPARTRMAVAVYNGTLFVFGGFFGGYGCCKAPFDEARACVCCFSSCSHICTNTVPHRSAVHQLTAHGPRGVGLYNDLHAYDFSSRTWTDFTVSDNAPAARQGMVCVAYNGKLLVYGGAGRAAVGFRAFHPESRWMNLWGLVPISRIGGCQTLMSLVAAFDGPSSDLDEYDIALATWTKLADPPAGSRDGAAAALHDGTLYLHGGEGALMPPAFAPLPVRRCVLSFFVVAMPAPGHCLPQGFYSRA
eukprot:3747321-Rhodomonas_salina.2